MNSYTVILQYPDYLDGRHFVSFAEAPTIREAVARACAECSAILGDELNSIDDLQYRFVFEGDCRLVAETTPDGWEWLADEDPAPVEPAPTATEVAAAWQESVDRITAADRAIGDAVMETLLRAGWFDDSDPIERAWGDVK